MPPPDFQETEKFLAVTTEPGGGPGLNTSPSFSGNVDGGEKRLEAEQNGHGASLRSLGSTGHLAVAAGPHSPSRVSRSRASSVGTAAVQEHPKDYLILVIISCLCPVWPVSIVALVYSIMVSDDEDDEDDGGSLFVCLFLTKCTLIKSKIN